MFFDSHFHLEKCLEVRGCVTEFNFSGCSCALDLEEFEKMEKHIRENKLKILPSFGVHPQNPDEKKLPFLEKLVAEKRIAAIGEIGFDFFYRGDRENVAQQKKVWEYSVALAVEYGYPIIVHNRKALDMMFLYSGELKKVPGVLFHSFSFGKREALSLLDKGIDSYFSFGKPLLRGSKKNEECVTGLPIGRILFETDAPFQVSSGESFSRPEQISEVYERASVLRKISCDELVFQMSKNFQNFFKKSPYCSEMFFSSDFISSTASL